ncbi:MAG: BamA/OMP85 family outer membrane protein, partial [Longimicrobiales bacterium]
GMPAVEVAWRIQEGEPAYINRVTVVGNTYTHEDVIRDRLLVLPGDVYSQDALLQSYQAISGLGFFETPLPTPLIEPTEDGDVNITFEVEERQTGSINFGTAIGGYGGLSGFLGYDQPNLFGQAKSGHLRAEFGRFSTNFQASYTDPSILGSLYSGSASVFSRNNRFGLNGGFNLEGGEYRQTGTSIQFGVPLPFDRWTRATIGYSIVNTSYDDFQSDETTTLFNLPTALQSSLTLGLLRNTLNHTLFPTAGTRQQLSAQLNGGPLGGDGDFQKYIFEGSWYVPAGEVGGDAPGSRPIRFTLGLNAEIGAIVGDPSLFPFERFFMGGVQFGRTLRGYEETTITPLGFIPEGQNGVPLEARLGDAYLRLSAEYAVRISDNLSLSTFYDAGNVWSGPGAINPARLFRGAGLGVTLVTPFGPLGLDYAYGFDKTDPGWQLHFKMGPTF